MKPWRRKIAARLQHEDGCKVEAVDLPSDDGDSREVLVAVTFFGAYSSQRTVRPDKTTEILYFRPPDELLLVYSPTRRRIEVCSRDPTERRLVARIFAEDTLKHDVSNKPLTQKTYNLDALSGLRSGCRSRRTRRTASVGRASRRSRSLWATGPGR